MIHEMHQLLEAAAERIRRLWLWNSLALCWLCWAAIGAAAAMLATRNRWTWPEALGWLVAAALVSAFVCWRLAHCAVRDPRQVARRIEARYPELGALLLSALEQAPSPRFKRLGYLESTVVREALDHGRRHNWADATPVGRLRLARLIHLAALAALAGACARVADRTGAHARVSSRDDDAGVLTAGAYQVDVEPGNAQIERGTTLVVIAKFRGAVPPDAKLTVTRVAGVESSSPQHHPLAAGGGEDADPSHPQPTTTRAMTRSLDDPQFVGRVSSVASDLTYFVAYADAKTPVYHVTVFDYPELVRADAQLDYPEFTRLAPKVVEDVRQVSVVEGTKVTLKFRLNKDVAEARLVDREGEEVVLNRADGVEPVYETSFTVSQSRRMKLHLKDADGRTNKLPLDLVSTRLPISRRRSKSPSRGVTCRRRRWRNSRSAPMRPMISACSTTA